MSALSAAGGVVRSAIELPQERRPVEIVVQGADLLVQVAQGGLLARHAGADRGIEQPPGEMADAATEHQRIDLGVGQRAEGGRHHQRPDAPGARSA